MDMEGKIAPVQRGELNSTDNEAYGSLSNVEKRDLVNSLLMSTAAPVLDANNIPYIPRKQGAGLANVWNAIQSEAYLSVAGSERPKAELKDNEDGKINGLLKRHVLGTYLIRQP